MLRPFRSETTEEQLTDLKDRLARTRFAPALSGRDWTHGTPPGYLAELVDYWRTEFDWPAAENRLNALPQFVTDVGGPLTDPAAHGGDPADAFDVIATSLPGFGFSPHPGTPGMNPTAIANLFDRLMTDVLGYSRYATQGGDFGAQITSRLGRDHGDHLIGIHLNLMGATPALDGTPLTPAEEAFLAQAEHFFTAEGAYAQLQGTKPATLAAGLSDSPAGLAAWIVEKFRAWSDCGGDVESVFSKDELLTDITLYWLTGTIATSARLYYETMHTEGMLGRNTPGYIATPTGFASFVKDNFTPPEEWVRRAYNLTRFTRFDDGGHFAALERPDELVTEIREFLRPLRPQLS